MKKYFLSACLFFAMHFIAFAGSSSIIFEENRNQWPSQVKYQADIPGGKLFLEHNTFTYLYQENIDWHGQHRNESAGPVKVKFHSFKVNFENSNPDALISGNNRYSWHRNYYLGNDPKKWADNVPLFSQVYYKDLYPGIDLQIYNEENNLKYDIIVHTGGKPEDIKLKYEGTDGMRIENGHLYIKTSVYDLIEQKPFAYQVINGVRKQIACSYVLEQNNLSFSVGSYDPSLPLIIDPTLIASTYSGSSADNWGFTATYDAAGNIYMGGTVWGTGYPITVGAHDQTYNGGNFDISLTKLNTTGSAILFSTYYGGISDEQPQSMIVNSSSELFVVGRTNSPNFPTTAGAYDATQNGGYDIIVGKFNNTGALLGSTFIGGTSDDCVNFNTNWTGAGAYGTTKFSFADDGKAEITIDASSNVYIAACTKSSNFPTSTSPYQAVLGGTQDAVIFKMNSTLTALLWSTYLGGTGTEAAYGIKLGNNNNVYVTGGTTGANFPATVGVLNQTYQGGITDGFISVFDPALSGNAQLLRSTFLGTSAYDQSFFIDIDASGDVYVFGQTQGVYPVTSGCYSNPNSGQFIHKLSGNLAATVYSTTIGNGPAVGTPNVNLSATAFNIDSCGTIYLAGWGRSSVLSASMPFPSNTFGLPVTTNAFQSTTDGKDFYIAVLTPGATGLFYATFFGENGGPSADHLDGGTCRFDKNGILYHAACASCGGTNGFPVTNGSLNGSSNCNEAVFKMNVAVNPIAVTPIQFPTSGCSPFQVCFSNTGSIASNFFWDFGDGSTSTLPSPCHTYTAAGTYTATLSAIDSIGICGYIDTTNITITVLNCTGLEELLQSDISVYPNPTSSFLTVSHPVNTKEISVCDVFGQQVYITKTLSGNHSGIDLSSLTSGIYFLQVRTENGIITRKIIKE